MSDNGSLDDQPQSEYRSLFSLSLLSHQLARCTLERAYRVGRGAPRRSGCAQGK